MPIRSFAAALLISVSTLPALAQDMNPVEDPRALGFDPAGLATIDATIETLSAEQARPGYACLLYTSPSPRD